MTKDIYGHRLYRTYDGNMVPFWAWLRSKHYYAKVETCPKGGKHISEVAHGGDFCIKCGKVGVQP